MKKLTNWINISSIALIIIGLIHLAATVKVIPMFSNLYPQQLKCFLAMYVSAGLATVLPGLIVKLSVAGIRNSDKRSWIITLVCSISFLLMGIGGVLLLKGNPFAYMGLIISISLIIPVVLVRNKL